MERENGGFLRLFFRNIFRCFLKGKFLPWTGKFAQDCKKKGWHGVVWALVNLQAFRWHGEPFARIHTHFVQSVSIKATMEPQGGHNPLFLQ